MPAAPGAPPARAKRPPAAAGPARTLACACTFAAASASVLAQAPPRPGSYREEARVERVVLDARVTDRRGETISGLGPDDFRVTVDGKRVALESAEWIPADAPEVSVPELPSDEIFSAPAAPPGAKPAEAAPGRLLIFFFQTDYTTSRLIGLVRMGLQARRFLDTLLPTDRVAVLSFDSHLKLRQDFTSDRDLIIAAIEDSLRTAEPLPALEADGPSLARHFDQRGARAAVTPERALALIASAAEPIPGGKAMLFFGWGLSTIGGLGGPNRSEQIAYGDALAALSRARITIFTLDVTEADYHSLEGTIATIAEATGGTYAKTHVFPRLAMDRIRRALAGRYVLVFKKPEGARGYHEVKVALVGRKGQVLAREYYED